MLTKKEFEDLWKKHFAKLTSASMPSYTDYCSLFKCYLEYLKHFSGREVRYILVAEAPPVGGAYVYNYKFPACLNTPYFNQVVKAFGIEKKLKLNEDNAEIILKELAKKGVLILDLFPFAIKYTTPFRKKLANFGVLKEFWDGPDYSIKTQIEDLCTKYKIKPHREWDLCLIAPQTISNYIVSHYATLVIKPCGNGIHSNTTFHALHPHPLRKSDWKKVAVSKSGFPNATLIKTAFDIK